MKSGLVSYLRRTSSRTRRNKAAAKMMRSAVRKSNSSITEISSISFERRSWTCKEPPMEMTRRFLFRGESATLQPLFSLSPRRSVRSVLLHSGYYHPN